MRKSNTDFSKVSKGRLLEVAKTTTSTTEEERANQTTETDWSLCKAAVISGLKKLVSFLDELEKCASRRCDSELLISKQDCPERAKICLGGIMGNVASIHTEKQRAQELLNCLATKDGANFIFSVNEPKRILLGTRMVCVGLSDRWLMEIVLSVEGNEYPLSIVDIRGTEYYAALTGKKPARKDMAKV